ncbi:MAG: ABC transporter ATP-binding protein [Lachnospiraceae bacterium]
MLRYIRRYLPFAVIAAAFMVGEVSMDLIQPSIMSIIVDEGVLGVSTGGVGDLSLILDLGLRMACLVILGGFCGSMNNVFVQIAGQNIGNEMRKDAFARIMDFSFPQADKFGTGSLITRVTNDITQVQNFVSQFVRGMIRTSMLMFGSIFCMFRLNVRFGLIVLCAFPFIVGTLFYCLLKANPLFYRLQSQLDQINSILQEDVSGIRIIKACVREIYEKIRFGKANEQLIKTQLKVLVIFAFMNPVINALMYVVVALILVAGSVEVTQGVTTPGCIMAAITYTTQLLNGIMGLTMLFQNISRGLASWKRVKEVLYCAPDLTDGPGTSELSGADHLPAGSSIEFRHVSFAYPGSSQKVLKDINLTIYPGETIAIMGATGCGKSTLVNLISRFYDVTEGAVYVDGEDVRSYRLKELRSNIAFALQKSELFGQSIRENISWGKPEASKEEIMKAAQVAQADNFILSTPEGYETVVAERGMSLSGGQRQRISISRAVVKDAKIMIFDDSTSALDLKTEADLHEALKKISPDSTKLIIAQRITSVRRADRIVVLAEGTIVDVGTHEELMQRCNTYRDIYDSQMEEDEHGR